MTTATVENAVSPETLLASLRWRYATKKFDPERRIPAEQWDALQEALVSAPSSFGLQPWKFFVVEDPALRARLKPASWDQSQIVDADKLVVFAVRKDFGAEDVERFVARTAEVRNVPAESLEPYKQMMLGFAKNLAPAARQAWAARQVYIALGVFLTAAAALGVDACPMEGIDQAKYDEILGLSGKGYSTLFVAAAGSRAADDKYATLAKVRYRREQVLETL
ncbi:MAG TPA: NAD(P)H-dependent oxidoreductase [Elusimicrobiota bacterium]|nr:NAD(P)H-dependent oxidoreductase [Elusimicrobiota bacterium]